MRHGFWKSLSHIALITLTVISVESMFPMSSLSAQDSSAVDQTGKVTKEPVFRVSKLVEDPQPQQQQNPLDVDPAPAANDRIANSSSMAAGTVIPGSGERNVLPAKIAPTKTIFPRATPE